MVQPTGDDTAQDVLRDADTAMFAVKRRGGGVMLSDRRTVPGAAAGIRTETELWRAMENGSCDWPPSQSSPWTSRMHRARLPRAASRLCCAGRTPRAG